MGAGFLGSPDRPAPLDDHGVCDAGVMHDRRSDGYQGQINPIAPMFDCRSVLLRTARMAVPPFGV
jgi:hypothetical protein